MTAADELVERVRAVLASDPVRSARQALGGAAEPDPRPLYRELGRSGLLAVDWPRRYGGADRTPLEAALVIQELVRAGVPDTLHVNTVQIVGGFLLLAGSEDQRQRYLPAFARGESFASVLYTEPLAGSDLGALRTTAVVDGDGYRLNGVKLFSLKTHLVDVALCAARTSDEGSRYAGISLFLIDLRTDGVHRTTMPSLADEQFHRVELHDVHVPAGAVVGDVGDGWSLLTRALTIERTGLDYTLKAERWLAAVTSGTSEDGPAPVDIGRYRAMTEASRALTSHVLRRLGSGAVEETLAAAAKYYSSELAAAVAHWAVRTHGLGYAAHALPTSARRELEAAYREAPGLTLSAGTSDMMLQIVANPATEPSTVDSGDTLARLRAALRRTLATVSPATDPREPPPVADASSGVWQALARLRVLRLDLPAAVGGLELGLASTLVVAEELGRAGLATRYPGTALAVHALAARAGLGRAGPTDAAGPIGLARLLAGGTTVGLAGFDTEPLRPRVRPDGWVLTGTVSTDCAPADVLCVPAVLDGGTALVLLERDRLPPAADPVLDGFVRLRLPDIPITPADVLCACPDVGDVLTAGRLRQASYLLGLAEAAHAEALRHVSDRRQFDRPLNSFQSVAFRLADLRVRLTALRALVDTVGDPAADLGAVATWALPLAAQTALDTVRGAVQVCGARALTGELTLHRLYRLARTEAARLGSLESQWVAAGQGHTRRRWAYMAS